MTAQRPHLTAGIDAGSGAVKVAIARSDGGDDGEIVHTVFERIRRRNVYELVDSVFRSACDTVGVTTDDMVYVASTGDGETAPFATGHFYTMTTHARGGLFLDPSVRAVLDAGALHARAIRMDERGRVVAQRMTSQCASGSGQFIENIARYLGVPLDDVGALSIKASAPEQVSGICAVLAETDVINMVSRDVSTEDILHGIHQSIAGRLAKLLRAVKVEGHVMLTGGLSRDAGLLAALRDALAGRAQIKGRPLPALGVQARTDERAIFAGAIGAALLGAYRHVQLDDRQPRRAA
jgi:benzoyl-CoA reductase subunit D